ncbi:MAG: putative metal-dependent hydrolase [Planctomycetes bacterium]|nr:putative metal-dependent hydrolase [Planctomycetota bacterium]
MDARADAHLLPDPDAPFAAPAVLDPPALAACIRELARLPDALRTTARPLDDDQLDTPHRKGGWTLRQIVHHVADSHVNGFVRHKWALTEERPTIKAYVQDDWAALPDSLEDVECSLGLLDALHRRWTRLLLCLEPHDFERPFVHPESGPTTVGRSLALYAWHGRHHLRQIERTVAREGWTVGMAAGASGDRPGDEGGGALGA